jgi:hypothetical protein
LQLRVLRVCENGAGLCADYEVCRKKFLGICLKKEITTDVYEFKNPETVKTLIDADFACRVRKLH